MPSTPNPKQPLENMRPQNIYEALLIREIDPQNEIAVLENGYETVSRREASSRTTSLTTRSS